MPYKDYEQHKKRSRENYYKNREKRIKQAKEYYLNNREKRDIQKAEWAKNNKDKVKKCQKRWQQSKVGKKKIIAAQNKYRSNPKNKNKEKARQKLRNAVRRGDIKKPKKCEECNSKEKLSAHHNKGYEEEHYLTIKWLCLKCHTKKHLC